jgi:hypothetical protein
METDPPPSFGAELWGRRYAIVYLALLVRFVIEIGRYHDPHTGFSSLIAFGEHFAPQRLSRLSAARLYTYAQDGYDGQFYAQLAVAGNPLDPELERALDSPSYRTRRILLPALAHVAGLGRPGWIVQAYALANLLCFLILTALLARWWFPPTDLHNLLRWVGTLYGTGLIMSVTRSLTDGPALLAIAVGARLVEKNRRLAGATVLAAAGLVRETSVLCAAVFAPARGAGRRAWPRAAAAALLCVAPTLLWAAILARHYGGGTGARNFDLPLVALGRKLSQIWRGWRAAGFDLEVRTEFWAVVALGTQAAFVLLRPRRDLVWWRIGAAFAVLWIFLGDAVWEASPAPSAATRAVLPLTLAFNVLAPRTRAGLVLLLAGNLTVLSAFEIIQSVPTEQTSFERGVTCRYQSGWLAPEHLGRRTWRWSSGSAILTFHNPTPRALLATLDFQIVSVTPRTVAVRARAQGEAGASASASADLDADLQAAAQSISVPARRRVPIRFGPIQLPPGDSVIAFTSPEPPWSESAASGRPLSFSVYDLYATIEPVAAAP